MFLARLVFFQLRRYLLYWRKGPKKIHMIEALESEKASSSQKEEKS